jgi:hypothetical protein
MLMDVLAATVAIGGTLVLAIGSLFLVIVVIPTAVLALARRRRV